MTTSKIVNKKWIFIVTFIGIIAVIVVFTSDYINEPINPDNFIKSETGVFGEIKTYRKNKIVIEGCEYWHFTDIHSKNFSVTHSGTCKNH